MFKHIQALKRKKKKKKSQKALRLKRLKVQTSSPPQNPHFFSEETYRWAFAALFFFVLSPPCGSSLASLEQQLQPCILVPGEKRARRARRRVCAVLSRRAGSPGQPGWEAQRNNPHKCGFNWHNYFDKDVIFNFERALTEAQHLQQRPRCQGRMRSARAAAAPSCAGLRNKLLEALGLAAFVQGAESSGPVVTRLKAKGRCS